MAVESVVSADKQAEMVVEQAYMDRALDEREKSRQLSRASVGAAADPKSRSVLAEKAERLAESFGEPDSATAFGRIDLDDGTVTYVGNSMIMSAEKELLVTSWKTPAAKPFYEATAGDHDGLVRKREFTCDRTARDYDTNRLLDFEDTVFADLLDRIGGLNAEPQFSDTLLNEIGSHSGAEMREIASTIQAAQYNLLRQPADRHMIVQGAPGSGKTAVALHRVSWLLWNERDLAPSDVLVVGPTRAFTRFIQKVLPSLGNDGILQLDLSRLGASVAIFEQDEPEVAAIKGSARMVGLLKRGLDNRLRLPDTNVDLAYGAARVSVDSEVIGMEMLEYRDRPWNDGRSALRRWMTRQLEDRSRQTTGTSTTVPASAVESELDRLWPALSPAAFVNDLLGSRDRLGEAAGDDFTARETRSIYRQSSDRLSDARWSLSDIALLDEATHLIDPEAIEQFRHVVVDEAQDLSHMQLRSVTRRVRRGGAATLLGDVAQATGPELRDNWNDIVTAFGGDVSVHQLAYGYRVPEPVYAFAKRLLERISAEVEPPTVIRPGEPPKLVECERSEHIRTMLAEVREHAGRGSTVGVIVPHEFLDSTASAMQEENILFRRASDPVDGHPITLLPAEEAKGLEFDTVVVVSAEVIADAGPRGLRLLYIAYTRPLRSLVVIHEGDPLGTGGQVGARTQEGNANPTSEAPPDQAVDVAVGDVAEPDSRREDAPRGQSAEGAATSSLGLGLSAGIVDAVASTLAEHIRSTLDSNLHYDVVDALRVQLGIHEAPAPSNPAAEPEFPESPASLAEDSDVGRFVAAMPRQLQAPLVELSSFWSEEGRSTGFELGPEKLTFSVPMPSRPGRHAVLFSARNDGSAALELQHLRSREPFDAEDRRLELLERFTIADPNFGEIEQSMLTSRVPIDLVEFVDPQRMKKMQELMRWFAVEVLNVR